MEIRETTYYDYFKFDCDKNLHVVIDGKDKPIADYPLNGEKGYSYFDDEGRCNYVEGWLKENGYERLTKAKIMLKRGKIFLKPAYRKAYAIKIKGTGEYIYSITRDGTYKSSANIKPLLFTKEDIDLIGNAEGFEIEERKLDAKARNVSNKLA